MKSDIARLGPLILQIIKRLRRIITIRKKLLIHKDIAEVKKSLAELGLPFPVNNFQGA